MFKTLYKKIDDAKELIMKHICNEVGFLRLSIDQNRFNASQANYTIEVQRQTIELLTNALQNKHERGLLIVSDKHNENMPIIIKDGKLLVDGKVKYASVSWDAGMEPTIEICQ